MRVVVLGSTGMLGSALSQYFVSLPGYEVYMSYRTTPLACDGIPFQFALGHNRLVEIPDADYVINCIGCIKQKQYTHDMYVACNTDFPQGLAYHCQKKGTKLIHISTDCVFDGKQGGYVETDTPTATDEYGVSKAKGEPSSCLVLRTSVIGPELGTHYGLLEWARSQAGNIVNGFTNHFWNGLTTTGYAQACQTIMEQNLWVPGLRHIFSTSVTKYDMLVAINAKYNLNLTITHFTDPNGPIDRTLNTTHNLNPALNLPSFQQMMDDL